MAGRDVIRPVCMAALSALGGCAASGQGPAIRDLQVLKQDCLAYVDSGSADARLIAEADQRAMARRYRELWFGPWREGHVPRPVGEVRGFFEKYARQCGYGENLLPHEPAWAAGLLAEADLPGWPNCRRRAITVANTSVRQMPTVRPLLASLKPGEAYPFDLLQESAVWAGTPVFVSHVTRGGQWVWAEASCTAGWMPARDSGFVDDAFVAAWEGKPLGAVVGDGAASGLEAKIGMLLPAAGPGFLAAARQADGQAKLTTVRLPAGAVAAWPVPATPRSIAAIANRMLGQPYGWGGLYGQRDCSATTRDLFTPLGLWLPRNSAEQAQVGRAISLKDLPPAEKQRVILAHGVPFLTLIHSRGHIMLYLGRSGEKPLVFHMPWGVKTRTPDGAEGRHVIGRCCITTLRPGIERPDILLPAGDLLHSVDSMAVLVGRAEAAP